MSRLLYVEGTVDRTCTQSHITYSFHIPQPTETIRIHFSYTPKLLEDQEQARGIIEESMCKTDTTSRGIHPICGRSISRCKIY
ncbi:hypothetical protein LWE69_04865 [Paenibacillus sp. UKAQ_18]|nr:hypothetical protein [Paenibacillus sp. UKAQ_18]